MMTPRCEPVRIILCTAGGIHGAVVLERLLACERLCIVGLVQSSRILRPQYGWCRGASEQIRRSGLAYALHLWCATSAADALGELSPAGSLSSLVRRHNIPRRVTRDINSAAGLSFIRQSRPDLLVSAFFNQRLGEPVFRTPNAGSINIHPSLLPQFKGVDPVFFARLNAAPRLGVTVHRVDSDFDTGTIICQEAMAPLRHRESLLRLTARLFRRGAELIVDHLGEIAEGDPGTAQDSGGSYDSWPTAEQVRRLRRNGTPLVSLSDLVAIAKGTLTAS